MRSLLAACALAAACSPSLPDGRPLDARAAYALLGVPSASQAPVYGVAPDCAGPEGAPGFWLDGACRGGLSEPGVGVFVVVVPGSRWSDHFAHEFVGHWAILPALDAGHLGPAFQPGGAVSLARATLALSGQDLIPSQ